MAQLEEMLNSVLSDPESMAKIMQIAQQFSGSSDTSAPQGQTAPSPTSSSSPPSPPPPPDNGFSLDRLGGLDPKLIGKLLPLLQEYGRSDHDTMQLLMALRPFLKPEKQDKIQRAARLARLIHLGKRFLTEWEES